MSTEAATVATKELLNIGVRQFGIVRHVHAGTHASASGQGPGDSDQLAVLAYRRLPDVKAPVRDQWLHFGELAAASLRLHGRLPPALVVALVRSLHLKPVPPGQAVVLRAQTKPLDLLYVRSAPLATSKGTCRSTCTSSCSSSASCPSSCDVAIL
jgi:hypothetical protein